MNQWISGDSITETEQESLITNCCLTTGTDRSNTTVCSSLVSLAVLLSDFKLGDFSGYSGKRSVNFEVCWMRSPHPLALSGFQLSSVKPDREDAECREGRKVNSEPTLWFKWLQKWPGWEHLRLRDHAKAAAAIKGPSTGSPAEHLLGLLLLQEFDHQKLYFWHLAELNEWAGAFGKGWKHATAYAYLHSITERENKHEYKKYIIAERLFFTSSMNKSGVDDNRQHWVRVHFVHI